MVWKGRGLLAHAGDFCVVELDDGGVVAGGELLGHGLGDLHHTFLLGGADLVVLHTLGLQFTHRLLGCGAADLALVAACLVRRLVHHFLLCGRE